MAEPPAERPASLGRRVLDVWITYAKGQLLLAVIIGGLTWLVSAAIGLRWALLMGAIAGLFESVPSVGPVVAVIPAVIVALWKGSTVIAVENWVFALIVLGAYLVIQQTGSLFIGPRVLGERLHLPGIVVFVGVIAGAALGGIVGALVAVPLIATLREVILYFRERPRSH
jgi:predicted PurR-regulated permease PerM